MADVVIGAQLQIDSGQSFKNLGELRDFIKSNKSELDKLTYGTKEYKEAQDRLSKATDLLNGAGREQHSTMGKITEGLKSSVPGFAGAAEGATGLLNSLKAIALSPVGIVIMAIAAAVALIKNAMDRGEESSNKLKQAFAGFSGIISGIMKFLEPLGKFLIDGIVKGFELAAKAAQSGLKLISGALSALGFESAAKSVDKFGKEMEQAAANGIKLAKAEAELDQAQRKARITQLQYQKDAEKLRQIRDDQTKSTAERVKANDQLGAVLKKQMQEELALAEVALKVANIRIQQEGQTKEALDAQSEALTNIVDIQERITGQESEQLANRSSLQKEAHDKAVEAEKQAEEKRKERIEKQRAFDDRITKARQENELAAIKDETQKKLKEQSFAYAEGKKALNRDLADKKLTQEQHNQLMKELEKSNFNAVNSIQVAAYDEEVKKRKAANDELDKLRVERAKQDQQAEAEKLQKARDKALGDSDSRFKSLDGKFDLQRQELDAKQAMLDFYHQQDLAAAGDNAEKKKAIEDKYTQDSAALAQARIGISNAEKDAKNAHIASVASTMSAISDLVGRQTVLGKGLAVAASIINTYQGATKAIAQGGIYGAVAAAGVIASGLKSVKEILKTKVPGQGDGGASAPTAPSASTPIAPVLPQAQTTSLDQASINGIGNAAGNRSFILESDVQNNRERTERLNRAARLG